LGGDSGLFRQCRDGGIHPLFQRSRHQPEKSVAVLDIWRNWATDATGHGVPGGHFLPEEAPAETLQAFQKFFGP
jgi:surfactin synthase thioesterase subunit